MEFNIEQFIDINYLTDERLNRRKTTHEIFTPYSIVVKLMDNISIEDWSNENKTYIDPACGNGNIILCILYRRIHEYKIPWMTALKTLYSLDLMEDNIRESRERVHELLRNIASDYDPEIADLIMDSNFVCHDFFTWNFEEWREMTDEEIKMSKKKNKRGK